MCSSLYTAESLSTFAPLCGACFVKLSRTFEDSEFIRLQVWFSRSHVHAASSERWTEDTTPERKKQWKRAGVRKRETSVRVRRHDGRKSTKFRVTDRISSSREVTYAFERKWGREAKASKRRIWIYSGLFRLDVFRQIWMSFDVLENSSTIREVWYYYGFSVNMVRNRKHEDTSGTLLHHRKFWI